jgi:hypothetical protein
MRAMQLTVVHLFGLLVVFQSDQSRSAVEQAASTLFNLCKVAISTGRADYIKRFDELLSLSSDL